MGKLYKLERLVWMATKTKSPLLGYYSQLMFKELEKICKK